MSEEKMIIKENGPIKAKITKDYGECCFLTMRNGYQWTGQPMTPELARLSIAVLQEYLDKCL